MQELTMDEIHEVTLGILKKIDEIASGEHLTYYMAYGTLIGVIRHQGFIPWDDDLDLMMLREDYDRLVEYFDRHEKELYPYKILTPQNNKKYPHMIARVCNVEYPVVVENEQDCGMGVFIDIYPMDGVGSDLAVWRRMLKWRQQLVAGCYYATRLHFEIPKKTYRIPDRFLLYLFAKCVGRDFFTNRLEAYKSRFDWEKSRYIGCAVWEQDTYEKSDFDRVIKMPFEGMEVPVPAEYDRVLRPLYDDYMKLPPEESRQPHHNYRAYKTTDSTLRELPLC